MDRLSVIGRYAALRRLRGTCRARAGGGELQLEGSAYAGFALHMNLACVLLHNPVAHRQPESCALMLALLRFGLGRKERIVDAVEMFLFDAAAGVLNSHKHAAGSVES